MRAYIYLIGIGILTALLIFACTTQKTYSSKITQEDIKNFNASNYAELAEDQTVNVNIGVRMKEIDPQKSQTTGMKAIIQNLFEGLVREVNGELQPGIALKWNVSSDGKKYTFYLRKSKWSDGSVLTAYDFEYSWKRAIALQGDNEYIFKQLHIKNSDKIIRKEIPADELGVKAVDAYTFEVELDSPCDYFLRTIGASCFLPVKQDVVENCNEKNTVALVSNGPFKLKSYTNTAAECEKNENYWDASNVSITNINFLGRDEKKVRDYFYDSYVNDEIDVQLIITHELYEYGLENDEVYTRDILEEMFYEYNVTQEPLNDPRVRKALSIVLDREYIVNKIPCANKVIAYGYMPDAAMISESTIFNDLVGRYNIKPNGNVKEAKELLKEAGYEDISNFPELQFNIWDDSGIINITESVTECLENKLGIKTKTNILPWSEYISTIFEGGYEGIAAVQWTADYEDPQAMLELLETGNAVNAGGYNNPEYNAQMDIIKNKIGAARRDALIKANNILMEDYPIIPIYYSSASFTIKNRIIDWSYTSDYKVWFGHSKVVKE